MENVLQWDNPLNFVALCGIPLTVGLLQRGGGLLHRAFYRNPLARILNTAQNQGVVPVSQVGSPPGDEVGTAASPGKHASTLSPRVSETQDSIKVPGEAADVRSRVRPSKRASVVVGENSSRIDLTAEPERPKRANPKSMSEITGSTVELAQQSAPTRARKSALAAGASSVPEPVPEKLSLDTAASSSKSRRRATAAPSKPPPADAKSVSQEDAEMEDATCPFLHRPVSSLTAAR